MLLGKEVIADTNFLIDIFRFKLQDHLFLSFNKLFITESILVELKFLASKKSKESKFAKLVLNLVESKKIKLLPKLKNKADDDLIEYAKKGYLIATNDRDLRKRLKSLGFKTIYLRNKKRIAMG